MSPADPSPRAAETPDAAPLALMEVLRRSTEYLRSRGCDSPRLEAELLLSKGLGVARLDLYLQFDRPMLTAELEACRELIRRRGAREPLAYILGTKEFRSLAFEVNRDVFVPRPETETLVEAALAFLGESQRNAPAFADIGTGSGCLAVSLAHTIPTMSVVATDRSEGALAVARRNAARHGVEARVRFVRCNQLDALAADAPLDGVVCNPPYVLPSEERSLPPELGFEPREALFAPRGDVGAVFESIAAAAKQHLRDGGALFVEIGEGQGDLAEAAFRKLGLGSIARRRDLAGTDRVVSARRC